MHRPASVRHSLAASILALGLLLGAAPTFAQSEAPAEPPASIEHVRFIELNTTELPYQGWELIPPEHLESGFLDLSTYVDMGAPLEWPHLDGDGHTVQLTTNGLAYYLADENQPSFTDGWNRWAIDGDGRRVSWAGEDLVAPPAPVAEEPAPSYSTPREYLYALAPAGTARLLDCIARAESGWNPSAKNRSSTAAGIFQFLSSTWAFTPEGRAGVSVYDPYANVRMGIWLYNAYGPRQWQVYTMGLCSR